MIPDIHIPKSQELSQSSNDSNVKAGSWSQYPNVSFAWQMADGCLQELCDLQKVLKAKGEEKDYCFFLLLTYYVNKHHCVYLL